MDVKEAVQAAGFTPREMTATLTGTIETRQGRRFVGWDGAETEILLEGDAREIADGQRLRASGTLVVQRERGEISSLFTTSQVEILEP